jgi:hypothetical protein
VVNLETGEGKFPMLPWRVERRFTELKNIIEQKTLEDISTLRFCRLDSSARTSLDRLIYQELDLCEWLGGAAAKRIFAVFNQNKAVNIIVKLANRISCSVECSVMLPPNAEVLDRHEIIARRGVASDRVVDTQVPQSSIYSYSEKEKRFTDVDAEIFGVPEKDIYEVRAAFKMLSEPETAKAWNVQHQNLLNLIETAKKSEITGEPSLMEGGK